MEKQYYIPNLEDFCVGFVYEYKSSSGEWVQSEVHCLHDCDHVRECKMAGFIWDLDRGLIRVPYLTKEQIESFGWEEFSIIEDWGCVGFTKGDYAINYFPKIKNLEVDHLINGVLFNGKCRCINDFRKILKLLEIK